MPSTRNVATSIDAKGQKTSFAYDSANRLTTITYADASTVSYSYDADGNRTSMADAHGTTSYAYDALDRVRSIAQPGGTVLYAYDKVGNRVSLTYPDSKRMTYTYDAANRLAQVRDWKGRTFTYTYDAGNNLNKIAYPNTTAAAFSFDAANRLTNIVHSKSGVAFRSFAYALDSAGNRTSVTDNGIATTFKYDPLNQLSSATSRGTLISWTYDAVGNRLQQVAPSGRISYTYDASDRMLTAGNLTFSYDNNGNLITKGTPGGNVSFTFDATNRLASMAGPGFATTFGYDGDGNRVSQNASTGAYAYVNDVNTTLPVVLHETGPDGTIDYGYGGPNVLESISGAFNYFYHGDALGSTVDLTSTAGTTSATYSYDAWGNALSVTGSVATQNKFRFTGQGLDPGTGLYYLRNRYLQTDLGHFISKDPIFGAPTMPLTNHRYMYGMNNPATYTDPDGRDARLVNQGIHWAVEVYDHSTGTVKRTVDFYPAQGVTDFEYYASFLTSIPGEVGSHPGPNDLSRQTGISVELNSAQDAALINRAESLDGKLEYTPLGVNPFGQSVNCLGFALNLLATAAADSALSCSPESSSTLKK
jgi:RHS repeat-associated protein